jgi:hypothetical protein
MLDVLEVVNSPAELPKYIRTRIRQESKAPVQNRENQTLRFDKPDYLVLSIPIAVRGAIGTQRESLSFDQVISGR